MKFCCSVFVFVTIIVFSICVGLIKSALKIDVPFLRDAKETPKMRTENFIRLGNETGSLIHFIQVTDIHISLFQNYGRIQDFNDFCNYTIDLIRPSVVLASGDLTDAKKINHLDSQQFREEWRHYQTALTRAKIAEKTVWLDIRGNHDNFNVANTKYDFYTNYSMQGPYHPRSYSYDLEKGGTKYTFVAIDATLQPGPKRPFNFIGILSDNETRHIQDLVERSKETQDNNKHDHYLFFFSHYPTSCILSPRDGVRKLVGNFEETVAYFCGHLHTMGGLIPKMYTLHKDFLELELADWMRNRFYRVAAMDNGLFSFVDVPLNHWPVVLITNPKNILFNNPAKEPISLQADSTHIRLLIWSPAPITECKLRVDQDDNWKTCERVDGPLFVAEWSARKYKHGIHKLEVRVADAVRRVKVIEQQFSLDGQRLDFDLLARFVLMIDMNVLYQWLFSIGLLICLLPLIWFRTWHVLVIRGVCRKPRFSSLGFCRNFIRQLWVLSAVDRIILILILYLIYISFGPWSFGDVIDGYFSVIFVWGIFVGDAYLPGTLTYLYGFLQLLLCQFPLIIIYASCCDRRLRELSMPPQTKKAALLVRMYRNSPFILVMLVELVLALVFWNAYGIIAFLLAPMRTWSMLLSIYLWWCCNNLSAAQLKSAAIVWSLDPKMGD